MAQTKPSDPYGYTKLDKPTRKVKAKHPKCSFCGYLNFECHITVNETNCPFFTRYNDGDTYHPKALAHKIGIYFLVPAFALVGVMMLLSTMGVMIPHEIFPLLAAGGFLIIASIGITKNVLSHKKRG